MAAIIAKKGGETVPGLYITAHLVDPNQQES